LLIKEYAYIADEDKRLDAVVKNTEYLLDNFDQMKFQIWDDVVHNKNIALSYVDKQNQFFNFLHSDLKVAQEDIDYFLDRKGYEHLIRNPSHGN